MKIKDLAVGQKYTVPLVVISATARETKTKKAYLAIEFFDGTDSINGNYWDWPGVNIPNKNAILDVTAQVTEWQNMKQLNIKGMTTNTSLHISGFMPSSNNDIADVYKEAYAMVSEVNDDFLRSLTLDILENLQEQWLVAPSAVSVHHAYVAGNLIHSVEVARYASAIAALTPGANKDLALVGGLLHDVGKLFGYKINGIVCELTDEGKLYEHTFIGANYISNYANEYFNTYTNWLEKCEMLKHIILSHHGVLEYGAAVPPASIEAHIVHHADALSAITEQVQVASSKQGANKFTDRIWPLENRPHLNVQYVKEVLAGTE